MLFGIHPTILGSVYTFEDILALEYITSNQKVFVHQTRFPQGQLIVVGCCHVRVVYHFRVLTIRDAWPQCNHTTKKTTI